MPVVTLFSVIESPAHPNFTALYRRLKVNEVKFNSMRKVIARLKTQRPDFIVAEFSYGYSNNYAGVNISNLDVFLFSLQKYAPNTRVLVMVEKSERIYVDQLRRIFPLHGILQHPVSARDVEERLLSR